jgi:hypothetical protein
VQRLIASGSDSQPGSSLFDRSSGCSLTQVFVFEPSKAYLRRSPRCWGDGALGRAALAINLALIAVSNPLFLYQIFVEGESTPDADFLVRDASRRS